jgi:hypothetical protein
MAVLCLFGQAAGRGAETVKPFDLNRFLGEHALTPAMLARHLRVSELYLMTVMTGQEALSERDRAACLALATRIARARRALRAVQIELPFAEPPETFTREFARLHARDRAATQARPTSRKTRPRQIAPPA